MTLRKILAVLLVMFCVGWFGQRLEQEYTLYRAQQAQMAELMRWLTAPVGTRTTDAGEEPVNRADAIALIVQQAVAAAKKD